MGPAQHCASEIDLHLPQVIFLFLYVSLVGIGINAIG